MGLFPAGPYCPWIYFIVQRQNSPFGHVELLLMEVHFVRAHA
jgi:hypothetical protein